MTDMELVLMRNLDLSEEETKDMVQEIRDGINDAIANGANIDEVYAILADYGLEPDYMMEAMGY